MNPNSNQPNIDQAAALVNAARESADVEHVTGTVSLEEGGVEIPVAFVPRGCEVRVMDDVLQLIEERAPRPPARVGTATLAELASFVAHVKRFTGPDSAIFADTSAMKLTAVYDYHPPAGGEHEAAWLRHQAVYTCPLHRRWQVWTGSEGKGMTQDAFGAFLDENMDDLASGAGYPAPADVVQMARKLTVVTGTQFKREVNPTTGEVDMVCKNEHDQKVSTAIPRAFLLKLPVFQGGEVYAVEARLFLRMPNGNPVFHYELHRRQDIVDDAFLQVRDTVVSECGLPLFAGSHEE